MLTVITGNKGKLKEIASFLQSKFGSINSLSVDLDEIQSLDVQTVISHKLAQAFKLYPDLSHVLVEDTILTINGMGKLPGTLIKFFLGELGTDGLYNLARSMGSSQAIAATAIGYAQSSEEQPIVVIGEIHGSIVNPRGEKGFGWDAVFQPLGSSRTFGQMDWSEKEQFSMRAKALDLLIKEINRGQEN